MLNKQYQIYSFWFDPTRYHLRRECLPLHPLGGRQYLDVYVCAKQNMREINRKC